MMPERKLSITRWNDSKGGAPCLQTDKTGALEAPKELYACRFYLFVGEQVVLLMTGAIATCRTSLMKQSEIMAAELIIKSCNR